MILEFDSRRAGRARRPQNAIRRAARRLKTTPHGPQERVAGEGAVDADAAGGCSAGRAALATSGQHSSLLSKYTMMWCIRNITANSMQSI